jgi:hypothetical protein
MQSAYWIALLRRLPPEAHNQLSVTTVGGTEVMVQSVMILDGECLVFKGRLSGSQDTGRLFYVPYDQIDYIGFTRFVSEDEFHAWYDDAPAAAAEKAPAETNGTSNGAVNGAANGSGNGSGPRANTPNRAALLERVRARTTMADGTSNGSSPGLGLTLPTPPPTST